MCIVSQKDSVIAVGQAGGFVDIIKEVTGPAVDDELNRIMERERKKRGVSGFNSWFEKYQD